MVPIPNILKSMALSAAMVAMAGTLTGCGTDEGGASATAADTAAADTTASRDAADTAKAEPFTFSPDDPGTGSRVALEPTGVDEATFEVRVMLRDFKDLFGAAAHVRYDPNALELLELDTRTALEGGRYWGRSVGADSPKGRVLLGTARYLATGQSPFQTLEGIDIGRRTWARLRFRVRSGGDHRLDFDPASVVALNSRHEEIDATWAGLTVHAAEVTR